MNGAADESLFNVIRDGICQDIRCSLEKCGSRATLILILSGVDAMAWLDRPDNQGDVTRDDFASWANEFLSFESGTINGTELYSARCAVLHSYGAASRLTRNGKARQIGFVRGYDKDRDVWQSDEVPNLVLVSVEGFANIILKGSYLFWES
ncbi:MAG: hypothetical protein HY804_13310 [Nitrospinae bacterium]|nr:hypothetical protein [Nitrospinota bacterium]